MEQATLAYLGKTMNKPSYDTSVDAAMETCDVMLKKLSVVQCGEVAAFPAHLGTQTNRPSMAGQATNHKTHYLEGYRSYE